MKRRDFLLKSASTASALAGAGLFDYAMPMPADAANTGGGLGIAEALEIIARGKRGNMRLEIRPEIRDNPRAVFLIETRVDAVPDERGFFTSARPQLEEAGKRVAGAVFTKGREKGGSTVIIPNFTSVPDKVANPTVGIITSPDFIAGFIEGLHALGNANTIVGERGGSVDSRRKSGVYDIFDSRGIRLIEANYKRFADYDRREMNWHRVPGKPMVWRTVPTIRPVGDKDCFFINMPKLKCHNLGLTTLSVKNLQGTTPTGYGHFCNRWPTIEYLARYSYETDFDRVFVADYYQNVEHEFLKHRAAGFKHWDIENAYPAYEKKGGWDAFRKVIRGMNRARARTPEAKEFVDRIRNFMDGIHNNLMYDETWCQRAWDCASAVDSDINIIEGVIGRDGSGFDLGTDYLVNYVVVGRSKLETDSVASYIMGQNPLELFYTRIGNERGFGENDPGKIAIYWIRENGEIEPLKSLTQIRRAKLGVNLHSWSGKGELMFW